MNIYKNGISARTGSYLTILLVFYLFGCINSDNPDFINRVPDSDQFEYHTFKDWSNIAHNTLDVDVWFDNNKSEITLYRVEDIIQIRNGSFWVADLNRSMVYEVDSKGKISHEIFKSGRGPGDIGTPVSMYRYENQIYTLDIGLKQIVTTDLDGIETNRFRFKEIPPAFGTNKLTIMDANRFIWPSFLHDPVLTVRDSTGTHIDSLVKPVIPTGFHPIMHNSVMYEYDNEKDIFAFGYHGVPLIMVKKQRERFMLNLDTQADPDELNFNLLPSEQAPTPGAPNSSVYNLIREIYFDDDSIWVGYRSSLIKIPFSKQSEIKIFNFKTPDGEDLIYHDIFKTDSHLFFVTHHTDRIFRIAVEDI
jgi:hypothetical protein